MDIIKLLAEETRESGFTHKAVITHADLTETATGTAQVLAPINVVNGSMVTKVAARLDTAFKNTGDAAFNTTAITVGDGGSANRFLASMELNENGTEILAKEGTGTLFVYTATDTVDVTFNSQTGKALNDLNTGKVTVFFSVVKLGDL